MKIVKFGQILKRCNTLDFSGGGGGGGRLPIAKCNNRTDEFYNVNQRFLKPYPCEIPLSLTLMIMHCIQST